MSLNIDKGLIVTEQHRNDVPFEQMLRDTGGGMQYTDSYNEDGSIRMHERVLTLIDPASREKTILTRGTGRPDDWTLTIATVRCRSIAKVDRRRARIIARQALLSGAMTSAAAALIIVPLPLTWFDSHGDEYDAYGRIRRIRKRTPGAPDEVHYERYDALSVYNHNSRLKKDSDGHVIQGEKSLHYCPTGPVDGTGASIPAYNAEIQPPRCRFPAYTTFSVMSTAEAASNMT